MAVLRPFLVIFCQLHKYLSKNYKGSNNGHLSESQILVISDQSLISIRRDLVKKFIYCLVASEDATIKTFGQEVIFEVAGAKLRFVATHCAVSI